MSLSEFPDPGNKRGHSLSGLQEEIIGIGF